MILDRPPDPDLRNAPIEFGDSGNHVRSVPGLVVASLLVAAGAALNLWMLVDNCAFDLAGDEAHYWEWSRHLDLSYYSKGPLVAYLIALGRYLLADASLRFVGSEMLAVRAPALALSVLSGIGLYVLAARVSGRPRVGVFAVLLSMTVPLFAAGSFLMTIDAPLMCAWTWMLVFLERSLSRGCIGSWIAAGLLIALGILAKFTMVLVAPVLVLLLVIAPALRIVLRRPGIYVAALLGVLGFVPILIWNAGNDWVSFRHVAGQAGLSGRSQFDLTSPLAYIVGQALLVNPIWFVAMWFALIAAFRRRWRTVDNPARQLLVCAAIVPWGLFLAFSFITKIQPNWPAQSLIPAIALLADWGDERLQAGGALRRWTIGWAARGALLGVAMVLLAHRTDLLTPMFEWMTRGAPAWSLTPAARLDPTSRLRGWSKLAEVEQVVNELRAAGKGEPFILADDYQLASEIAFYCPDHPTVYCAQAAMGDRYSQYDLWKNPIRDAAEFIGRPCVYVGQLRPEVVGDARTPAVLPGLRKVRTIEHYVGGLRYQIWCVFACDAFAGFPPSARERGCY